MLTYTLIPQANTHPKTCWMIIKSFTFIDLSHTPVGPGTYNFQDFSKHHYESKQTTIDGLIPTFIFQDDTSEESYLKAVEKMIKSINSMAAMIVLYNDRFLPNIKCSVDLKFCDCGDLQSSTVKLKKIPIDYSNYVIENIKEVKENELKTVEKEKSNLTKLKTNMALGICVLKTSGKVTFKQELESDHEILHFCGNCFRSYKNMMMLAFHLLSEENHPFVPPDYV